MWHFDERRHRLTRNGETHRLEPKAVAVLARLAATPGEVVTKVELLDAAWPDQYVSEEVLTNAVYQIRKALGDDARRPRFIETIPKRGYRLFEAPRPVGAFVDPGSSAAAEPSRSGRRRQLSTEARDRWSAARRAAAMLAALVLATVGALLVGRPAGAPHAAAAQLVDRGWSVLESATTGAETEAAILAREAIALAPEDPDAWALSSMAWTERAAAAAHSEAGRHNAAARRAAARALELAPHHPRALAARARTRWLGSWDWHGAESDLRTALASDPDSAALWTDYGELVLFSGRVDEARRHLTRALELGPASARARITAALAASVGGDAEEAARHYREVLERHPGHAHATRLLAKLGRPLAIRTAEERIESLVAKDRVRPGHVALWFLESEDDAAALSWLDRAIAEHDPTVLFFRFDSRWDRLRDHPHYRAAMSRAGIAATS